MRRAIAAALLCLAATAVIRAAEPVPLFEEIISNLKAVNGGLQTFEVEQIIDARVWFLRYRLLSTVYAARPARYRIVLHDAPWFLRPLGTVFAHVGSPEDLLTLYAPRAIDWRYEDGRRLLWLDLVKRQPSANPPAGEVFVDPERWLVQRMVLRYEWGDVFAEYTYGQVGAFWLPVTIRLRVPRYAIDAVATYQNYRLNVPLDDGVFTTK